MGERFTPEEIARAREKSRAIPGGSFVVSLYGIEGKREHWIPGNRKRGTEAHEKRGFANEEEALGHIKIHFKGRGTTYQCSICGKWHTASLKRR